MQKSKKSLVAATFEKAKSCVFADLAVHNPKVGGSIPPPATNGVNRLALLLLYQIFASQALARLLPDFF